MSYIPFGFSKNEFSVVTTLLGVLIVTIFVNLQVSYRKSRDMQRKSDIGAVYDALYSFHEQNSFFPLADDKGRIIACLSDPANPSVDDLGYIIYEACDWGEDTVMSTRLPRDPFYDKGYKYIYFSSGKRFQLFASLEGKSEAEYDLHILARNLSCGTALCNFGLASGVTPLDKSIQAYENEIQDDL